MAEDKRQSGRERPYLKHSIEMLEGLFKTGRGDPLLLQSLVRELSFRSTDRAARLRRQTSGALGAQPPNPTAAGQVGIAPEASPPVTEGSRPNAGPLPRSAVIISPAPNQSPQPKSQVDNEPAAILSAWTALEALSPQTYRQAEDMAGGDRACVAVLRDGLLPWQKGERSRPNKQLYYQVVLGAIPMDRATERLAAAFGEEDERPSRLRDKAAIAAVLVDRHGVPVAEHGIAVSSFGWALPIALRGELDGLGAWPEIEPTAIAGLDQIVRRNDSHGKAISLDAAVIEQAHRWLVAKFSLPEDLVEPPAFALRVYHYYKANTAPEIALLNSFFMGDLNRAAALVRQGTAPTGLRRYLGSELPDQTFDLLADRTALERAVAPHAMPAARWPARAAMRW